jgi:type VI secretion system secreted protein VgrG
MEHEGIFYYFDHQKDKSVMVIADDSRQLGCLPGFEQLRYFDHLHLYEEGVSMLRSHRALRPGKVGVNDRRQEQPSVDIGAERCAKQDADLEQHLHPARSASKSYSERLAQVRLEELRATHSYVEASANCRALQPGVRFQLVGHRRAQSEEEYVIVTVRHQGTQALALQESHHSEANAPHYQATLRCMPRQVPFRPALATPRPVIAGVQTAQVVGPNAEEVHVDDQGRIKLHFHWDRHDQNRDDASSAWVRVSQPWAGNGYGVVFLPRVGHEVLVQFLDGDPERPVVVGRIFNGEHLAPHSLPPAKNISTIRSESTPGGGGFHEIRFDDSAGQEEMFIHAQRNLSTVVRQHDSTSVGANQQLTIGANQSVAVAGARVVSVGGAEQHEIQGTQTLTVRGGRKTEVYFSARRTAQEIGEAVAHPSLSTMKQAKHAIESFGEAEETTIHGTKKLTVRRNWETKVKNKLTTKVGGRHETVVGGKLRCVVGRSSHETVKSLKEVHAKQEICLHSQAARTVLHSSGKVTISVGKTKVILKENQLSLRSGGGAQLLLDGDEITLKAAKINIQARAKVQVSSSSVVWKGKVVSVKGSAQATLEAPKVSIAGGATTDVTGGVTTVKGTPIKLNC